jgi:hypothetical protein
LLAASGAVLALQPAQMFTSRIGIGIEPSQRGEVLRVGGWTILGASGRIPGTLTFMPPDGTGWYHIDNPGGQRLRISGGGAAGQHQYVTISHPGRVTIHGDLIVTGDLVARGAPAPPAATGGRTAQSTSATLDDIGELRKEINWLGQQVEQLQAQVNALRGR